MKFLVTTPSTEMTTGLIYIVKLPDIFDFHGQIFIFCNFLRLKYWKGYGSRKPYIYYKYCFVHPTDKQHVKSVEVYHFLQL